MILEPLITVYVLEMGVDRSQASLSSGIVFSAVGIAAVLMAPGGTDWRTDRICTRAADWADRFGNREYSTILCN